MELIIDRTRGNKVFLFEDGFGEKVWEPEPVTRFRFKDGDLGEAADNDWLKAQLAANQPTAGIFYKGKPYIGTNDGFIYTPDKKIPRIPELLVDTGVFLDEFPFNDEAERKRFNRFLREGFNFLQTLDTATTAWIMKIKDLFNQVSFQKNQLDRYVTGYLAIRGFAVHGNPDIGMDALHDGSVLGIFQTETGASVNPLAPYALCQLDPHTAGFVPAGLPVTKTIMHTIQEGIEARLDVHCVDYRSLWSLDGWGRIVEGICPRDGSGYSPARFATDGELIAISHGNHPCYRLEILRQKRGEKENIKSRELDPQKTPTRLLIREGMVVGDCGNSIIDYMNMREIFAPEIGEITSIADSGLCTVSLGESTTILNPFAPEKRHVLKGEYVFLQRCPQ